MQSKNIFDKIMLQLEAHKNEYIVFWGASNFLKDFISNPYLKKYNILGIVDGDKNKWNSYLSGYNILSPDNLNKFKKPICIIDTVINKYLYNYNIIKNIISANYKTEDIKLLPDVINAADNIYIDDIKMIKANENFEYVIPTKKEIEFFQSIGDEYKEYSEMSDGERLFITTLVQRHKPKKILEIGVSKGGSSFLILNAMKTYRNAKLYSLDYNTEHYSVKGKKTGFFMDKFPHLKENWSLHTGGLALNFLDKISSSKDNEEKFDFCFLDTTHSLPGELIDFIQILPYMKQNSILVLHDTNLQAILHRSFVNNILMSCIRGKKLLQYPEPYPYSFGSFSNIGAIHFNKTTFSSLYEIFNLLALPWSYMPCYCDLEAFVEFLGEHYPKCYSDYFKQVILLQEKIDPHIKNYTGKIC